MEETEDPHVIGGLMKQFLGSLVNPVVPFNMYSSLMQEYSKFVSLLFQIATVIQNINLRTNRNAEGEVFKRQESGAEIGQVF